MKPRVVLDTNILISAILYGGNPGKVVNLAISEQIEVFISFELLEEFERVLRKKFTLDPSVIETTIFEIKDFAEIVSPENRIRIVKKDPSDDRVLECAVEAKAHVIVSGDKHLLDLGAYKNIKIASPAEFLESI